MKTLTLLLILATCSPSYAQEPPCYPTDDVYAHLDATGATRLMWADTSDGKTVEVFVSKSGWTMFVSLPNSTTCYITSGTDYGIDPNT